MSNWIPSMWQRTASMSPEFDVRHTPAVSIRPSQIESGEFAQDGMFNSAVDGIADRRLNLGLSHKACIQSMAMQCHVDRWATE